MEEAEFQRSAEADGFAVTRAAMTAGRVTPEHDHAWDIRGMVLEGCFTVSCGGTATVYRHGEVFEVSAGVPHSERHDPEGGWLLVGRRQPADPTG